ncbi:MAG: ribonuclease III [Lachnospiraceae bacterium]|nr:ribonuclease III [Lachnospiraceae bacterium]MDY4428497.1 ribonuclease III [Lachnospiraceae bacterium]MDY4836973.1 ribonuclease III [Lachnospiraceae bacterium]
MNDITKIKQLQDEIGYKFSDENYLVTALSHTSYVNEVKLKKIQSYERQEFLGDAVLELTVSDYIFSTYLSMPEGEMTKLRASLVCEPTLAYIARTEINLSEYLLLGKGEDNTGGRDRDSIISDVFEALIGAIYLDGGLDKAKCFIQKYVLTDMEKKIEFVDSKTRLQEKVQAVSKTLEYVPVSEEGPAHDKKYTIDVYINGEKYGTGIGRSKKSAEQHAAYEALKRM